MTWVEHHSESEKLAAEAGLAARAGDCKGAEDLYAQAARAEVRALHELGSSKPRTFGITGVSGVALWYKARRYEEAQRLAHRLLGTATLPAFAIEQLQVLLQTIWSEQIRARAGIRFSRGEVLVSVKGGQVVSGGAPLDLIVSKVETIESLFYRTAEFLGGFPHRTRGPAPPGVQQRCRPWLFQAAPASYQFAVAVEEPAQGELFGPPGPPSDAIAQTFLTILRASAEDPDETLVSVVPDPSYRATFLKLARNLAPTGKSFSALEVRSPADPIPVTLRPDSRHSISEAIRRQFPRPSHDGVEETLHGVLRAVHLDKDWLEVTLPGQSVTVYEVGEAVDDVIGPLVNKSVIVDAIRLPGGRYRFRDIQGAE
jgi:hypothetical protein